MGAIGFLVLAAGVSRFYGEPLILAAFGSMGAFYLLLAWRGATGRTG